MAFFVGNNKANTIHRVNSIGSTHGGCISIDLSGSHMEMNNRKVLFPPTLSNPIMLHTETISGTMSSDSNEAEIRPVSPQTRQRIRADGGMREETEEMAMGHAQQTNPIAFR